MTPDSTAPTAALDSLFGPVGQPIAPVTIVQPVAWGELDALGHVNHTVFLRWFENARFEWFVHVGIAALMHESRGGQGPILVRIACDYRVSVGFPDTIRCSVECVELGTSSITLRCRVGSEASQRIVAEGEVVVVLMDRDAGRPIPVPEPIRAAIRALDGATLHERGR